MSLPTLVVQRRRGVIAAWLIAAAALAPFAAAIDRVLDVSVSVLSSESAAVDRLLASRFHSPFAHFAVLVVSGLPSPTTEPGESALVEVADSVGTLPGVTRVLTYADTHDSLFLGPRARDATFLIVGLDPSTGPIDALVPPLRAASESLAKALRIRFPAIHFEWTGEVALNYDLRRTSADDARHAELRALPLTAVLLAVAFGSVVAAFIPIGAAVVAIVATLGTATIIAHYTSLSLLLENVASMLGLGLGVDYTLLIVSRFREALSRGATSIEAAEEAARAAGHTVFVSGSAVAVGFAALLVVPLNELRAIAVGGLIVTVCSVLVATTLVPAVLACLGSRTNAGRFTRSTSNSSRWLRWGTWVAQHPWPLVVVLGGPMLLLASQSLHLSSDLPRGDWLPPRMESARGLDAMRALGHAGVLQTIRVVVELPPNVSALEPRGWRALERLSNVFGRSDRIAAARSLPQLVAQAMAGDASEPPSETDLDTAIVKAIPIDVRRSFVSDDGHLALVELVPREGVTPQSLSDIVRHLRAMNASAAAGLSGVRLRVGGLPAFNDDYRDAIDGQIPLVVALVIVGTFAALLLGFRSILIPLKAVVLNLLTVGAAIGALTVVFQDGVFCRVVGLDAGTGSVFPAVPVIVFCTVFGLSMDYEVFLVARVAEARRSGFSEPLALAEGLGGSGRVITSAAAIMIVVFGAFAMGDFLLVKMLGFTLSVAVLLDATVIRIAVGPALLRLAGRWNWWPADGASFLRDLRRADSPT